MDNHFSPPPIIQGEIRHEMNFPDALKEVIKGDKITRVSWTEEVSFGLIKDGWLMLFIRGDFFKWTVNDGDLLATDWIVYPETN